MHVKGVQVPRPTTVRRISFRLWATLQVTKQPSQHPFGNMEA